MKIRKIIDICKQNKNIIIFHAGREQWISDGIAIFPMFNLPRFDENSLCKTYDITEKQKSNIRFRCENTLPAEIDFSDHSESEQLIVRGELSLNDAGRSLTPYRTSQGILFMDGKYMLPLSDIEDGMLNIYERQMKNGQIYFAIKSVFLLVGIVIPIDVVNDRFVKCLKSLAEQCEIALYNKKT